MCQLIHVAGYECPETISPQTKRMLRKLRRTGVVVFRCDNGPSALTHEQLVEIAGDIGLDYCQTRYEVVLIDTNIVESIDGAADVRDDDYPEV